MRINEFRVPLVMLVSLTLLTGLVYPLTVTAIAQLFFPVQANGSLVSADGVTVGSSLIGQATDDPHYFWSRPSAVDTMLGSSLDALGSSGATNFSSTNAALAQIVAEREAVFRAANNLPEDVAVPVEMLFTSGSGLDPHISPEAARLQAERVAEARGLSIETVKALVEAHIETPVLGFLGQPRVNVLLLNLALDALE
jgi:K+-transporting ATPase ATPase C chain